MPVTADETKSLMAGEVAMYCSSCGVYMGVCAAVVVPAGIFCLECGPEEPGS